MARRARIAGSAAENNNSRARARSRFILPAELESPVRAALARLASEESAATESEEILAIGQRCAALPDLDARTAEEILGYDPAELPDGSR